MAIELRAEPRAERGKELCKKLRANDVLPGNIYGGPLKEPRAISFPLHETEILLRDNGRDAEYVVLLEGESYPVRIQEAKTEPIYKNFLHLDLVVKSDG